MRPHLFRGPASDLCKTEGPFTSRFQSSSFEILCLGELFPNRLQLYEKLGESIRKITAYKLPFRFGIKVSIFERGKVNGLT